MKHAEPLFQSFDAGLVAAVLAAFAIIFAVELWGRRRRYDVGEDPIEREFTSGEGSHRPRNARETDTRVRQA